MKAVLICTDGFVEPLDIPKNLVYETLKESVEGYLEGVTLLQDGKPSATMYINEEGKILNLAGNTIATNLYLKGRGFFDIICGNAVVCGLPDNEGYDTDIPDSIYDTIYSLAMKR